MAEFLCDTMEDRSYGRSRGEDIIERRWTDLPCARSSSNLVLYIPRPANNLEMSAAERIAIAAYTVGDLLHMVSIYRLIDLTDQELRGLLHCRQYLDGSRDLWWGRGRYDNSDSL